MSLYLHIPFCRKACSYCDFHFSVNHERIDDVVNALVKELELRKNYLQQREEKPLLATIYFGGGTPSLLSTDQLLRIFKAIENYYVIAENAEITLEANPDDLTPEKLAALMQTPVNRLSIGVQSFFEKELVLMNRAHTAEMALQSVTDAYNAGFKNITIDLIYGVPGMSDNDWLHNLETAFSLPVQHLSCYSLTVEKKTALDKMIRDGKVPAVDEDQAARHFRLLIDKAQLNGFEHYEISNFARPGFYSKHNSSYWKDHHYIGIGPSAHSYNGISRQWNIASNAAYVIAINNNEIPAEEEVLTLQNRYNEYLMTGLRTNWGVDLQYIRENFGESYEADFLHQLLPYIESGDLMVNRTVFTLSEKGKLIADRITAKAFIV
ncbi:MAG: radical SAM family heme chaperone HemW [Bacteroidota bacterium]|nr:radical SAM family heme chaperone HemW [Bacteroidota bacterium]